MLPPNAVDEEGNTPLHYVAQFDLVEVARWLIDNGFQLDILNNNNETPLDIAVVRKRQSVVRYFQKIYVSSHYHNNSDY